MEVKELINQYIISQIEPKQSEMRELHSIILEIMPSCKLWFLDGKDDKGKTVSNPNIGYGIHTMKYANGTSKEFYQIGLSANTSGISIYFMGLEDKDFLTKILGNNFGKSKITGYCVKFKTLKDINLNILISAIRQHTNPVQ